MINRVVLVGRLTRDVEVRKTQSGLSVAQFTVACDRRGRSQDNAQQTADFISCVAWRQPADFLGQYARKGALIGVDGRLQSRSYELWQTMSDFWRAEPSPNPEHSRTTVIRTAIRLRMTSRHTVSPHTHSLPITTTQVWAMTSADQPWIFPATISRSRDKGEIRWHSESREPAAERSATSQKTTSSTLITRMLSS